MSKYLNKSNNLSTRRNVILLAFSGLLIVSLIVSFTFSKYSSVERVEAEAELEDFHAAARLYYEENGHRKEAVLKNDENSNVSYIEMTPEQFKTVTVDVEYTGKAKTYCRFKLDCSWFRRAREYEADGKTREYTQLVPHQYPTFECDEEKIYNNIAKDGYFYFKDIMESGDGSIKKFNVISNVKNAGNDVGDLIDQSHKSEYVRVALTVDCVQYNRVSALWKMNSLPWWE